MRLFIRDVLTENLDFGMQKIIIAYTPTCRYKKVKKEEEKITELMDDKECDSNSKTDIEESDSPSNKRYGWTIWKTKTPD